MDELIKNINDFPMDLRIPANCRRVKDHSLETAADTSACSRVLGPPQLQPSHAKMPSKKKKYNSRFPPGRIKKIMQTDDEVGKVAQAVPVIISRALELFVESLLTKAVQITTTRKAKTLTPSHMKQCILSEGRFDFLKEFVKTVPDLVGDTDDIPGASSSTNLEESCPPPLELPNGFHISVGPSDVAPTDLTMNSVLPMQTPSFSLASSYAQMQQPHLPIIPALSFYHEQSHARSRAGDSSPVHLEIDEDHDAV